MMWLQSGDALGIGVEVEGGDFARDRMFPGEWSYALSVLQKS